MASRLNNMNLESWRGGGIRYFILYARQSFQSSQSLSSFLDDDAILVYDYYAALALINIQAFAALHHVGTSESYGKRS